jgi:hypothetical protein
MRKNSPVGVGSHQDMGKITCECGLIKKKKNDLFCFLKIKLPGKPSPDDVSTNATSTRSYKKGSSGFRDKEEVGSLFVFY